MNRTKGHVKLGLRLLVRDWRVGELNIVLLAVVLAVASVTTVGFFTDRIQRTLNAEANQLLGADLVIIADHPVPGEFQREARRRRLSAATTLVLPSMATRGDRSQLVEIKAVSPGYPLRGRVRVKSDAAAPEQELDGVPTVGTIWVADRVLDLLDTQVGEAIELGRGDLKITAIVAREPDHAFDVFNIAPRVMMNIADVPGTELVQTGSRVSYRLLVGGAASDVTAFRAWAQPRLGRGERIEGVRDARPEVRNMLERAERFLGLSASLAVILAAVAVGLGARRYSQRHLDTCALLRCFGASGKTVVALFLYQLIALALCASVVGILLGLALQFLLVQSMASLIAVDLAQPSAMPMLQGLLIGFILLLGFALPPILRLREVPTLRVLRRDVTIAERVSLLSYLIGCAALAALLAWRAGEAKLAAYVIGGFLGAVLVSVGMAWLLVVLLRSLRMRAAGTWRYGLANISRHASGSVAQIAALAAGVMALLALTLVRGDLMQSWRSRLPPDAPNRFVINIQNDQLKAVRQFFEHHALPIPDLYPTIRGRLTAINDRQISAAGFEDPRLKRQVEREFNLTWAAVLRPDNQIVAGRWPNDARSSSPEFSVEEWIAQQLGIRLDDRITFNVAGTSVSAKVTSIRKVEWDSLKVNFYVIATPGVLDMFPTSYITSFHLPRERTSVLNDLVRAFPNLTIVDVAALMDEFRRMTEQVARAVQFIFLFTLAAGLLVLFAAIGATQDERRFESAIMRTVGATRAQIRLGQFAEFSAIGACAGLVAALGATALSYVLSVEVLNLSFHFNAWIFALGVLSSGLGVAIAGLLGTRKILQRPPLEAIRSLA